MMELEFATDLMKLGIAAIPLKKHALRCGRD